MPIKMKKAPPKKTAAKKQKDLLNASKQRFEDGKTEVYGIFLIRQGLKSRTEQILALAESLDVATYFCETTLMPKYCSENVKNSIHTLGKNGKPLPVNKTNDLLLIKHEDFVRTEEGRTNANPLWYWNIAKMTIITKRDIANGTT